MALTAAHCVTDKQADTLKIRAGEWNTQKKTETYPHRDHKVEEVVIHEKFNQNGLHNDLALLFLKEPVELDQHINTICLPPRDFDFDGSNCVVSGMKMC